MTVYGSILMRFSELFSQWIALSDALQFSFLSLDGDTIFAKLRSKIAKSPKNLRKRLCARLLIDS